MQTGQAAVILLLCIAGASTLTCYNGMKLLRMQSVGQSTEECTSASAYCYNMTSSAMLVVDAIKAGCSTWRCMLAQNKCISTYFQMVPVSLCCCSSDRCNVGENAAYDTNTNFGNNQPGNNNNNDGFSNQNNEKAETKNWGTSWSQPESKTSGTSNNNANANSGGSNGKKWTKQEIEDKFKNFDVDHRSPGSDIEEEFVKVDARLTTPSTRGNRGPQPAKTGSSGGASADITIP